MNANNLIWLGNAEQSLFSSYDVDEEKDRDMQQAQSSQLELKVYVKLFVLYLSNLFML